ncbi:MAG: hypothetical protein KA248_13870 [Kiritimatiellae bacterium]|nr:hypothetical protein [Kiritimatiellia bacterium]
MSVFEELMQASLSASDERKQQALNVLRGLPSESATTVEPYLTLKAVALKLNLDPSTLWRWRVPKHTLSGRPRFLISEIQAYLQSTEFKLRAQEIRAERREKNGARP